jgi:hypothetical protein
MVHFLCDHRDHYKRAGIFALSENPPLRESWQRCDKKPGTGLYRDTRVSNERDGSENITPISESLNEDEIHCSEATISATGKPTSTPAHDGNLF